MRVGILIAGSLYWDPKPIRDAWRRTRLNFTDVRHVSAPIRYGRLSVSRGNTFTIVFAQSCSAPGKSGTGMVVGAAAECRTADDLITEARHLWAAERNTRELGPVSANWGRVAILPNPHAGIAATMLEQWRLLPGRKRKPAPTATGESAVVDDESGLSLIAWPVDQRTGQPLDGFELLLMTATAPTLNGGRYPTASEIAAAWRHDSKGHVAYFHSNRKHSITTFEDDEIARALSVQSSSLTP